ncbi:DEAD/DEAH box helicase [Candidatus Microgenomates bacterium]|nr:MAG: DEAD/DEAH box helicase [Candidatus Microgenomates bacterium]
MRADISLQKQFHLKLIFLYMYKHHSRFGRKPFVARQKHNGFGPRYANGGGSRGVRRVRMFDPSRIVSNLSQAEHYEEEKYIAKHSFSDFSISESLKQSISKKGYTAPTPIQDQAIPEILSGRDVVGIANTGTGKTAAFLIPLIQKVQAKGTRVLIVAPTRELAVQIESELASFVRNLGIYSAICIGGVSINGQIKKLSAKPQFVIGTPGRLLDLSNQRKINFSEYNTVVLDEVDRMLDMGFIHDMKKIINNLPQVRQSLFFSATLDENVKGIMRQFINDPIMISVKVQDSVVNVEQRIVKVNGRNKAALLQELLDDREFQRVLVFGRTKRGADKLSRDLSKCGFRVGAIHGNKTQNQRQRSLDSFKRGEISILVATDVVARGVDIESVTHVINYELPETYEDYLHRIGRTARAGKRGVAITFV